MIALMAICGPLQISSQVFAKLGVDVVALTRANFTDATLRDDALVSSYTRCESADAVHLM